MSRAFSFLDENLVLFSHQRSGGRRSGFTFTELFCTKIQDIWSSLRWVADRENCRPSENLLTKINFSSRGRGRDPSESDLSDIPDLDFVTKVNFSSRGSGGDSAGRYLIARRRYILLTKIAPVFARAVRRVVARIWLIEFGLPSPRLRILAFICMNCIQNYRSFGWKYCSVQPGLALAFCGNMCVISSVWFSISPHIKILYACPFSMPNLPFLWIWLLSYRKWLRPPFLSIWQSSFGFILDYFRTLSYRYDCNHSRIDMMILMDFLIDLNLIFFRHSLINTILDENSPIEMTATSYWYEGKERGFLTLCYLSIWVSFFLSLIQKIWRSLVSFWRVNSYAKWPFILGTENTLNGTANPRPKTLNLLSFQSDGRFLKKILLKSY